MTFTSDERREVAERLRAAREFISILPNTTPEQSAYDAFKLILACVGYERGNVFDILADLIDSPTCSIKRGYQTTWGVCSRCGALVNAERAVSTAIEFLPTRYCPWCGKEIEND